MSSYLSPADQKVLEVARLIANDGLSYIEAITKAGVQWSERTFGQNVNRVLTNPALKAGLGAASRTILARAVQIVGGEAVAAVSAETLAAALGMAATKLGAWFPWLIAIVAAAGVTYGVATYLGSRSGDAPVEAGPRVTERSPNSTAAPCPSPLPLTARKCPWTPEGAEVKECPPGYCWDGGFRGSGSCQQEESVPNSWRNYGNALYCNEGYKDVRDPCTNAILRCVPQ